MNAGERAALEDRVCLAYPKLRPVEAHNQAPRGRTAYRCPFGHGHWHLERLTVDEMAAIAAMLRDRRDPATSLDAQQQAR